MTNDYKELLLKYLTGNLTNDYDVDFMTPYYEEVDYNTDNEIPFSNMESIQCLDGEGKPNGKSIFYEPNFGNRLYLVDNEMNIINVYDSWYTGTEFDTFLKLGVDEIGQFYGIDYNETTQKFRFILLNNLSEPTKMTNGSMQFRAVLRNSYFIQGYSNSDGVSPRKPVYLAKSKQSATYYFALTNSNNSKIMPSTLTINVGAANEWVRLANITLGEGYMMDSLFYFNSEETPNASYFFKDNTHNSINRIDSVGENEPGTTTLIPWSDITTRYSNFDDLQVELKATGQEQYYLFILGYIADSSDCMQVIQVYKNGFDLSDWLYSASVNVAPINSRIPKIKYMTDEEGNIGMFYRLMNESNTSYDDVYFTFIPINPRNTLPHDFFNKSTTTKIVGTYSWNTLMNNTYNLHKFICQSVDDNTGLTQYTIVSLIFDDDNYNTNPFEKNGDDIRTLVPNQGILYDTNNKPIFARNLYNLKIYKNKTTSVLNVPNNILNDVSINKNEIISVFNNDINENSDSIEKNIYEDLYINYFNTLTMQNQNRETFKDNIEGASRINQSASKLGDYENARATKIKITYDDGTTHKGGVDNSITNGICTYEFYVYVPDNKTIKKIDIMSEDEETIYQTIDYFPESLLNTKTYKIQQDVRVE